MKNLKTDHVARSESAYSEALGGISSTLKRKGKGWEEEGREREEGTEGERESGREVGWG